MAIILVSDKQDGIIEFGVSLFRSFLPRNLVDSDFDDFSVGGWPSDSVKKSSNHLSLDWNDRIQGFLVLQIGISLIYGLRHLDSLGDQSFFVRIFEAGEV